MVNLYSNISEYFSSAVHQITGNASRTLAAENAALKQKNAELTQQLSTDPVTGGHNRYAFNEKLQDVIWEMQENPNTRYELVFLDLDGFKQVNDNCGHDAGDEALWDANLRLEEALSDTYKGHDLVARLGGDEMGMLLKHDDTRDLSLDNIRQIVRKNFDGLVAWNFENSEQPEINPIGASIGSITMSAKDMGDMSADDYIAYVLKAADEAMYADKQNKIARLEKNAQDIAQALIYEAAA